MLFHFIIFLVWILKNLFVGGNGISSRRQKLSYNRRTVSTLCKAYKNRRKNLCDVVAVFMTVMKGRSTDWMSDRARRHTVGTLVAEMRTGRAR